MKENVKSQETVSQKCASCGGDVVFNPKTQNLVCEQCNSVTQLNKIENTEKFFEYMPETDSKWETETSVYECKNCGAKEVVTTTDIAVKCDYCGATNVVKTEDLPGLRPDSIVLFKITKDEAIAKAKKWLSKKFFAPHDYKKTVNAKGVNGIYFPAFTFDARTGSDYNATEVEKHTTSATQNGETVSKSYETRRPVSGYIEKRFDDILVPATSTISKGTFKHLAPFDTNNSCKYEPNFLSGYTASQYTKDADQAWAEASLEMSSEIKFDINRRHSHTLENLTVNTRYYDKSYKYTLLPVYVGHSEYKGKKYNLYINGETGKVYGKSPQSLWKVLLTVAGGLALVGGAIALALFL